MKKIILQFLLLVSCSVYALPGIEALKEIPLQDAGRYKPYDTFAREALQLIYGKQTYESKSAAEIIFTWALVPQVWDTQEIVQIRYNELKKALALDVVKNYFKPVELMANPRLPALVQDLRERLEAKEKLNPYFQAVQRLENQLSMYRAITEAKLPTYLPVKGGQFWLAYANMPEEAQIEFNKLTQAFAKATEDNTYSIKESAQNFARYAYEQDTIAYPDMRKIRLELHYNNLHPFKWAWIIYLVCAISCLLMSIFPHNYWYKISWISVVLGFVLHTYGFAIRIVLAGRPPVTNMYETVVWVSWGAVLFAMFFEWRKKTKHLLLPAAAVASFCLILGDLAPTILDASIQPLEPVLRSNLWLTVHVLTITISYAAFFLAFALGDQALFFMIKNEDYYRERILAISQSIYKVMQVGVVLLAAGTILGGVWADYSWGRFWGWDPKETWALIALLGYLAIMHARIAGLIHYRGIIISAILVFSLVIMAWYGVNYILGAGLHSYGFGGGGVEYVAGFVALHVLYCLYYLLIIKKK